MNTNIFSYVKGKTLIYLYSLILLPCLLFSQKSEAGLDQMFKYGQAGRFSEARTELKKMSEKLEAEIKTGDITIIARNSAAQGFYSVLSQVAKDSETNKLKRSMGRKLFTAGKYAADGDIDKAASLAREVTTSNTDYSLAYSVLGRVLFAKCLRQNKNCDQAIWALNRAIELDKTLAVSYLDLGVLLRQTGDREGALSAYNTAITEGNDESSARWAHFMLAMLYSDMRQWDSAKSNAEKARDLGLQASKSLLVEINKRISQESSKDSTNDFNQSSQNNTAEDLAANTEQLPKSCMIKEAKTGFSKLIFELFCMLGL